jgi:sigma-B regulation protein RsbU (phosphoserine phosphatase)
MAGIDAMKGKLVAVLISLALLPMICIGIISLDQMEKASIDVQNNISGLSTSLNRSTLASGKEDAGQVQLAIAKASQYDQFFKRIASENEVVAGYASVSSSDDGCISPPGIWIAPTGSNQTASLRREATVNYLCGPAKIMQEQDLARSTSFLSYIGTEDGVLAVWPYSNKTLSNTAPFGYRDMPYYSQAVARKKTFWTGPYQDSRGDSAITITTPFYREGAFAGIAGMQVPLYPIYQDLSSMKGRGYPFIIDSSGLLIYRSDKKPEGGLNEIFEADILHSSSSPEVRSLARTVSKESSGSIVVELANEDWYVAFSRINEVGWTLCIAYPAEEMSLPARFIDSGVRDVAESTTAGLYDAEKRIRDSFMLIFILTVSIVLALAWIAGRRIDSEIASLSAAAEKISRGDFNARAASLGILSPLGESVNRMAVELKKYAARMEEKAVIQGRSGRETVFLEGVKRSLVPAELPSEAGYDIRVLYRPSDRSTFDLYDISHVDGRIAFALAGVGGDGVQAAILAVMSRTLIVASPDKLDPARAIADLNSQISRHGHGTNLACFYALLDPLNHSLEYVNAGFNPPFIVDAGGMVDTLGGGGIALGMLDRMDLDATAIPIQPGDVMVMYSNGVVEAKNAREEQYGIERLINLVIKNRDKPAYEILSSAEVDFLDHSGVLPASSDVTLIILKRTE